jgi:hypothetical protein
MSSKKVTNFDVADTECSDEFSAVEEEVSLAGLISNRQEIEESWEIEIRKLSKFFESFEKNLFSRDLHSEFEDRAMNVLSTNSATLFEAIKMRSKTEWLNNITNSFRQKLPEKLPSRTVHKLHNYAATISTEFFDGPEIYGFEISSNHIRDAKKIYEEFNFKRKCVTVSSQTAWKEPTVRIFIDIIVFHLLSLPHFQGWKVGIEPHIETKLEPNFGMEGDVDYVLGPPQGVRGIIEVRPDLSRSTVQQGFAKYVQQLKLVLLSYMQSLNCDFDRIPVLTSTEKPISSPSNRFKDATKEMIQEFLEGEDNRFIWSVITDYYSWSFFVMDGNYVLYIMKTIHLTFQTKEEFVATVSELLAYFDFLQNTKTYSVELNSNYVLLLKTVIDKINCLRSLIP